MTPYEEKLHQYFDVKFDGGDQHWSQSLGLETLFCTGEDDDSPVCFLAGGMLIAQRFATGLKLYCSTSFD